MNRGLLPYMLNCTDITVLERQRARSKWQQEQSQQQQQQESYFSELRGVFSMPTELMSQVQQQQQGFGGDLMGDGDLMLLAGSVKLNPAMENGWPALDKINVPNHGFGPCGPGLEASYDISSTSSCLPAVALDSVEVKAKESAVLYEKMSAAAEREGFKKRKADKATAQEASKDNMMKGSAEEGEHKITEQNNNNNSRETSADTSKENSKASEVKKPDYIHVRARRGQATDSHSLAERVRREKISERMKFLQELVPGCNKITGKAGMLDEIINYVQSLQRQVEFLSTKLAAVNPRLDFNIDNFFAKEAFPACPSNFPTIGMLSEMTNPAYLPFHPQQRQQEPLLDSSCLPQLQPSTNWDADLQNYYNVTFDQGRSTPPFPSQPFTGSIEASNLNMEM